MLERRRSYLRRALASGVLLALLAVVPLFLTEMVYVLAVRRPEFGSAWNLVEFIGSLLALQAGTAVVAGVVIGPVLLWVAMLAQRLAQQRLAEPRWFARLLSVLAVPWIAVVLARIFQESSAQRIPGKHLIAVGMGVVALSAVYVSVRLIVVVRDRFRIRRWGRREAALIAAVLVPLAVALYVADQRLMVGTFGAIHVVMALLAFGCCQLTSAVLFGSWRPSIRRLGRLMDPGVASILAVSAIAAAAWGLGQVEDSNSLRRVVYRDTAVQSKIVRLASMLGFGHDLQGPSTDGLGARPSKAQRLPSARRQPRGDVLGRARAGDTSVVTELLRLCEQGSQYERREALQLLLRLRQRSAKAIAIRLSSDRDPGLAIPAMIAAAYWGHVPSIKRLPSVLKRSDLPPELRRDALVAAARAGDRRAAQRLGALQKTEDSARRNP